MKKNSFFIISLFISALFQSCEPEPVVIPDYRDVYVGVYDFTTYYRVGMFHYDNGVEYSELYDTARHRGSILKDGEDRLKITFLPHAKPPIFTSDAFPVRVTGIIYPVVGESGKLTYPDFLKVYGDSYIFNGNLQNDTLRITYMGVAGILGDESTRIEGVRISK